MPVVDSILAANMISKMLFLEGPPDLEELITNNILHNLIFALHLSSMRIEDDNVVSVENVWHIYDSLS